MSSERIDTKAELVAAIERFAELDQKIEELKMDRWRLSTDISLAVSHIMPDLKKVDREKRFQCGRHIVAVSDDLGREVRLYSLGTDVQLTADNG